MKVRQLLGWTRPATPTDMALHLSSSHHKQSAGPGSSNNADDEIVYAPFDEMGKLSIDDLKPGPGVRPGNNNRSKEDVRHIKQDKPEEDEDKVSTTIATPDHSGDKQSETSCTSRCSSEDSSNSSTASSSRSPSGDAIPTNATAEVPSPTASPPPKVTFRKGEKSFLDFHQHYAITRHLGEGSYSTVKQVTHRKKGGFYACKIVDKLSLSDVDRAALSHEVRVLSSVSHVNIMRLYEVIEDDAKCYLVTELAEGGDLFDRIVKQGKFPEREAQKVTAALVEALHYCHAHSVIHRDVKPENVLLSGDDVKLCDFGFARQLNHQEEQASDSCGTPGYAAPEILDGPKDAKATISNNQEE
ncbi:CAMK/CAMKL protein kinase [Phytophthora megakarya]|uniref:non-specific serine/threonine protein kinase n=1 Tax=Phytophthora megakarya TaxID=4795 RepID=A0A225W306_9STRA|nr:CAMK/CAMKL protein kinase [Phytophthora megakarya]